MAKILVVDDEPDMIWAITNVLLSENHSVVSVNSGEEALQKVREPPHDLVNISSQTITTPRFSLKQWPYAPASVL
jgi:CheY-like chemotaxis protein